MIDTRDWRSGGWGHYDKCCEVGALYALRGD